MAAVVVLSGFSGFVALVVFLCVKFAIASEEMNTNEAREVERSVLYADVKDFVSNNITSIMTLYVITEFAETGDANAQLVDGECRLSAPQNATNTSDTSIVAVDLNKLLRASFATDVLLPDGVMAAIMTQSARAKEEFMTRLQKYDNEKFATDVTYFSRMYENAVKMSQKQCFQSLLALVNTPGVEGENPSQCSFLYMYEANIKTALAPCVSELLPSVEEMKLLEQA